MKIALLGSTGFVGKVLLKKALIANHIVKVLVRDQEKLGNYANKVEIIQGEYFDPEKLKLVISGTEAVISTIGAPGKNSPSKEEYIKAMQTLISIMKDLNIKRFILIGGAATRNKKNEIFGWRQNLLKFIINTFLGKHLIQIKQAEFQILLQSDLDWTIVRPPRIVSSFTKHTLNIDENKLYRSKVMVDDLAEFMLDQLVSDKWIRKTPLVS
jgi:uncharacterized protein